MTALYLKEETKPLHDALEQKMMVGKIFDRTLTKDDYHNILKINLLVHQEIETAVTEKISEELIAELNLDERLKTPYLIKDIGTLESDNFDFKLDNSDEILGSLYVMEGATLGGNVIKKQLLQNPEFKDVSFHYYGIYGESLAANWKSFLNILEEKTVDKKAVLAGATKTYNLFLKVAEEVLS